MTNKKPLYKHSCDKCQYLGTVHVGDQDIEFGKIKFKVPNEQKGLVDLYVCDLFLDGDYTFISRYSDTDATYCLSTALPSYNIGIMIATILARSQEYLK
jgi:hypothetical protein